MMNSLKTVLAALTAVTMSAGIAHAATIHSPEGVWVTNGGESKYQITLCGDGDDICAKMIWADDSALGARLKQYVGKDAVIEVPRIGDQRWRGKIDWQGNVVRGTIDITDASNIHIKGCNGAVCQTVELIKVSN
jgi:uncharacterized protein (DUF2147 family)